MAGTTVTTLAKKKMVKARAGISSLPKIVGMAFGDGGVDPGGRRIIKKKKKNNYQQK